VAPAVVFAFENDIPHFARPATVTKEKCIQISRQEISESGGRRTSWGRPGALWENTIFRGGSPAQRWSRSLGLGCGFRPRSRCAAKPLAQRVRTKRRRSRLELQGINSVDGMEGTSNFVQIGYTFIVIPWVRVCPVHELLVYPCEETYGRVGKGIS
jgi:hypothetical protein